MNLDWWLAGVAKSVGGYLGAIGSLLRDMADTNIVTKWTWLVVVFWIGYATGNVVFGWHDAALTVVVVMFVLYALIADCAMYRIYRAGYTMGQSHATKGVTDQDPHPRDALNWARKLR